MIIRYLHRSTTFTFPHRRPTFSYFVSAGTPRSHPSSVFADRGRHATFYSNAPSPPPSDPTTTQRTTEEEQSQQQSQHSMAFLAQMNFARLVAPMDDDRMKEFALAMDPINQLARSTPGFVWSLDSHHPSNKEEDFDEYSRMQRSMVDLLRDDPLIQPQLSLWRDMSSLRHFVFKSGHAMYYKRKKEWFHPPTPDMIPYSVCWWHDGRTSTSTATTTVTSTTKSASSSSLSSLSFQPPSLKEAFDRCHHLKVHGPTPYAFDFATHAKFPMPSSEEQ